MLVFIHFYFFMSCMPNATFSTRQDDDRVRELRAATNAESALLSKIISSVVVPKLPAERQVTFCSEESNAVIQCYQSRRSTGEELKCTDFVDTLEACTSNATRVP